MRGRGQVWIGGVVAVGALVYLTAYLIAVGLDKADKVASVVGLFVGLAGLVVSILGLRREDPPDGGPPEGGQSVRNSWVGEGITMVRDTRGNVQISHTSGPQPFPVGGPQPPPVPPASPPPSGTPDGAGQHVHGTTAGGPVDLVDGTGGNVEIR
ncbi:hypothetical protein PV367_03760 [Streptomyces europaeiscabiei]|uniref:Uncharacterized protein n=1 Tax=Streptomyces europaeiscabiei TaxID=146819 RepID=A0AAJ2PK04_9ACTN|nr:hypothetical protein [Streptomyces europaeiscabiei]MDX3128930.1 hypothetical protein [Streptomyces europaeiscabiei]MDX3695694.1 hypothetical protein [Streptomyces europaeiscabiei]